MAVKVKLIYCLGTDTDIKDRQESVIHASLNVSQQLIQGLRPIKRSWTTRIPETCMSILITVRQFINDRQTKEKIYEFNQLDSFDYCMYDVIEKVKAYLRPKTYRIRCNRCERNIRVYSLTDTLCKKCKHIDSVSKSTRLKTAICTQCGMPFNKIDDKDTVCNRCADASAYISSDKTESGVIGSKPKLYDCTCIICGKPFKDVKRLHKCPACTVSRLKCYKK